MRSCAEWASGACGVRKKVMKMSSRTCVHNHTYTCAPPSSPCVPNHTWSHVVTLHMVHSVQIRRSYHTLPHQQETCMMRHLTFKPNYPHIVNLESVILLQTTNIIQYYRPIILFKARLFNLGFCPGKSSVKIVQTCERRTVRSIRQAILPQGPGGQALLLAIQEASVLDLEWLKT